MRKAVFLLLLSCHLLAFGAPGAVPVVPSTIEIAGVKLKLTSDAREEIQKDVNALRASEKYFRIKLDRINLYFPIIERVLKEEGVPEELKYLSIQESALISDAVSSANAVGYWQFKDFTAREVGLRVDGKVDERKNIVSATRGAAKYFKRNNFYFKNWIYAVSAYQAGPAGAKKYVDKENFGSDKLTITSKTHWYVLRFIAHVIAFQDEVGAPHSEGLKLAEHTKGAGKTLGQIANQYKVDHDLVKDYNKWLSHGSVPDDKEYAVIIPIKGKLPKDLEDAGGARPLTRTIEAPEPIKYPDEIAAGITSQKAIFIKINGISAVMAGDKDNLVSLALKCGITSDQLIKYNDLRPGQQVTPGEIYYTSRKKNRSAIRFHVARHGETLWDISQKYGIKVKKLAQKNRMDDTEKVAAGRLMWLTKKRPKNTPVEYHAVQKPATAKPKPTVVKETAKPVEVKADPVKEELEKVTQVPQSKPVNEPTAQRRLHVVQPGETLWGVSKRYQVTVDNIIGWNALTTGQLATGQELLIYSDYFEEAVQIPDKEPVIETKEAVVEEKAETIPATTPPTADSHEVQPGESLWAISRKYELSVADLREWNGLTAESTINPGQKLLLKPQNTPAPSKSADFTIHVVKGGDSLYKIARDNGMTVQELMELNQMESTALSVGDELKVKKKQ